MLTFKVLCVSFVLLASGRASSLKSYPYVEYSKLPLDGSPGFVEYFDIAKNPYYPKIDRVSSGRPVGIIKGTPLHHFGQYPLTTSPGGIWIPGVKGTYYPKQDGDGLGSPVGAIKETPPHHFYQYPSNAAPGWEWIPGIKAIYYPQGTMRYSPRDNTRLILDPNLVNGYKGLGESPPRKDVFFATSHN